MLVPYLHRVAARENLSAAEAHAAMLGILSGEATVTLVAAFLVALRMKGETAAELTGFARAMREKSHRVHVALEGEPLLDTCGTGADGAHTFNISTIAAFVAAGASVRVAKHGNRSISSRCGSADLLEALGVGIGGDVAEAIRTVGIGFMFAPAHHPAMKHAQPARLELKMRTVFNLLGPLTNPAGAQRQLIGAPSVEAAELMAGALAELGTERSFVVHGAGGLDEVSTAGETLAFEVAGGAVARHMWVPEDFGVPQASLSDIAGGDAARNAEIARAVLDGAKGPQRDIVLVNAAAALVAAGRAASLREGVELAAESIGSRAARGRLEALAAFTRPAQ
ncbi:MAG TPA: anthranilate phosphoribosyltransferase [Bryobacteraceae bacterium]|nr:anthranilate phosphoribosyltransferase [Bryobacteraceae bacterium]